MPWMSRLLGPLSETISRVSERASALAADQIAGAGIMAPAAIPEADFKKSRRFMGCSKRPREIGSWRDFARFVPNLNGRPTWLTDLFLLDYSIKKGRTDGK